MWPTLLAIAVVALFVAAGACAYLFADRRSVRWERDRERGGREQAEAKAGKLDQENRELVTRLERLSAEHEQAVAQHEAAQKQARETFENLAGRTLKEATDAFLKRAGEAFDERSTLAGKDLEARKAAIENMLKPIRETLDKHAEAVGKIEKEREGSYHALRQQITTMHESYRQLGQKTEGLVTALRQAPVRGRWGEVQLRRIAELAGMVPHCDFDEQVSVKTIDGVQKPDMVVQLPAGRSIVIDSKAPMSAFLDAIECEDEDSRAECFRKHVQHIEQKVRDLASKRYQDQFERAPDFVVLFIPGESFLQAAVQLEPGLIESAMNRSVVIATPSTLISLLKAVEMGWREERVAENAREISELGQQLHERIAVITGYAETLGKHLDNAVGSYNSFVSSLESRVLVTTRRFKELGADSRKELPAEGAVKRVESTVRKVEPGLLEAATED